MKRCEIPLRNMSDIVATCIEVHNLYIVSNKCIVKTKNKLAKRINKEEIRKDNESRGE